MKLVAGYVTGLLFGLGISVSGMANPSKVINFFDIAGTWDPSLAFVMGSALLVTILGYRLVFSRNRPIVGPSFDLPTKSKVDGSLLMGSAIFGIGWGIAGFCPGGALPVMGTFRYEVIVFVASLVIGIWITRRLRDRVGTNTINTVPQADG
jgi:uncharacterized membrane protein YedE/YeeE